jgi:hypothetical protein
MLKAQCRRRPALLMGRGAKSEPSLMSRQPIQLPLTLSYEDQGLSFFLKHYKPLILNYQTIDSPVIVASCTAVGMAALANVQNNPEMRIEARKRYLSTLSQITDTIQDPLQAESDAALIASLISSTFEASSPNGSPPDSSRSDPVTNHTLLCCAGHDMLPYSVAGHLDLPHQRGQIATSPAGYSSTSHACWTSAVFSSEKSDCGSQSRVSNCRTN